MQSFKPTAVSEGCTPVPHWPLCGSPVCPKLSPAVSYFYRRHSSLQLTCIRSSDFRFSSANTSVSVPAAAAVLIQTRVLPVCPGLPFPCRHFPALPVLQSLVQTPYDRSSFPTELPFLSNAKVGAPTLGDVGGSR